MKTQAKILILVILSSILIVVTLVFFYFLQLNQTELFENSYRQQRMDISRAVLKMQSEQLNKLVFDYSYYDEFTDYLNKKDSAWERSNFYTIYPSYNFEVIMVYDRSLKPYFVLNYLARNKDSLINIPPGVFSLLDKNHFIDFFMFTKYGLIEISGATIHKQNDINRQDYFYGYFFIAKCWNKGVIGKLEELSGGKLSFSDSIEISDEKSKNLMVSVSIPLNDWRGLPATYLVVKSHFPVINEFIRTADLALLIYSILGGIIMLVLFVAFYFWVSIPLKRITSSLESATTKTIGGLINRNDEFGEISRMLDKSFLQKKRLEQEIQERTNTEKRLQENEEIFSKAFMLNPSAIAIINLNSEIILSSNGSFSKYTGFLQDDLPGCTISKLDIFEKQSWTILVNEIKTRTVIIEQELDLKNRVGVKRHVLISGHILMLQDESCMLLVMTDITERKEFEAKLNQAKLIAEESDRLKSFLLSNMSHEFRTPLTGILGFGELLKEELVTASQIEMANHIVFSAERLQATFENIMDMAQIQAGNYIAKSEFIHLASILGPLLQNIEIQAETKNVILNENIDEKVFVIGDSDMIIRVMRNILDNAVKFTENGQIEVKVQAGMGDEQEFALITVKDTGIGINPSQIELIFNEFRQVSEGFGRNFEGSGLGLTVAKTLTELMGGKIAVSSELNSGSVFTIYLPISLDQSRISSFKPTVRAKMLEILIVDDDNFSAELMRSFLVKVAKVEWVKNEQDAIKILARQKFDLTFMEINLGAGGNGINIIKYIRGEADIKEMPVIAITGYSDRTVMVDESGKAYFNKFLTKPFKRNMILSLVAELT